MIKFMVLSAPRSASTWTANWLTTEHTLCLHDPVLEHHPEALDGLSSDRPLGIACTALALLPGFVNAHPARKVVVHRDVHQVNLSLTSIGLSPLSRHWDHALEDIRGMHIDYEALFDPTVAAAVYTHLTGLAFDSARHEQLCAMHVEPAFEKVVIKPDRARAFRARIERAFQ